VESHENKRVRRIRNFFVLAVFLAGAINLIAQETPWEGRSERRTSQNAPPPEDRIDINHASQQALLKVPGMTESWAGRIVRFRPYRTKLDLLDRGVVPDKVYDRIKDYIIAHRDKH
jgi:DNA uptake protein ComE-like DNA-binding protein